MKNTIKILAPDVSQNRIEYRYEIKGEWSEAFNENENFYIEYSCDISNVPESIAVIPLLCNILPISWIYDAEIFLESCDKAFYDSITEFKKGYMDMYPQINFLGKIHADKLENNSYSENNGAAAFFSGGVDAFNTLVNHAEEKPVLLTLWGADVKLDDVSGWKNVENHIENTAATFGTDYVTIKSCFRQFLNVVPLNKKVYDKAKDSWWHGFQHGIGIIGHAAPVCYTMNRTVVYFASSNTANEKGVVTCASDPTIDNYVKFGDSQIVHDGYEFDRQDKVHNIVEYSKKTGIKIPLRVCWQSTGGKNCCQCEKCWRTILEIIAEGEEPKNYDMDYTRTQMKNFYKLFYGYTSSNIPVYLRGYYYRTQQLMRKNVKPESLPKELHRFYKIDIKKFLQHPYRAFFRKCRNKVNSIAKKIVK